MKRGGMLLIFLIFLVGCTLQYECPECEECEECQECPECPVVECPHIDCNSCPPIIQTKNVTIEITKYVCTDGSVVSSADECSKLLFYEFEPVTTNEEGTHIKNVSLAPACVRGRNGGLVYFRVDRVPKRIVFETKLGNEPFTERFEISPGLFSNYNYFAICKNCQSYGDFQLMPDRVYLFRIKFEYDDSIQFSNEHIIDTRKNSPYIMKKC